MSSFSDPYSPRDQNFDGVAPDGFAAAPLMLRGFARLIDFVLMAVLNSVVIGTLLIGAVLGQTSGMIPGTGSSSVIVAAISAVVTALLNLCYFAWLESAYGRTVGKALLGLQTFGGADRRPNLDQAIRRNIWVAFGIAGVVPIIGGLIGGIGQLAAVVTIAIGISKDPAGRGWHDRLAAGTLVARRGGRQP